MIGIGDLLMCHECGILKPCDCYNCDDDGPPRWCNRYFVERVYGDRDVFWGISDRLYRDGAAIPKGDPQYTHYRTRRRARAVCKKLNKLTPQVLMGYDPYELDELMGRFDPNDGSRRW
jgi:hypothetical protein